ncbi:MAG: VWA domain-containing protein [Phycisphaerae bacterium]|nr:VWA domain-containing protein [Phycisphaerae bacterium]
MTFSHPMVLLLLAIPALLLWAIPARGAGIVVPFDHHQHPRRRPLAWLLGACECAPPLLLAAIIFLLAGPQTLQQPKAARSLTNIQFCMDVSGSMGVGDRYGMAKDAIENFVNEREGDAFGLTIFGSHQIRWTPLTKDLNAVRNALPFADPRRQPMHMGGTRIGAALRFCRENMIYESEPGDRMIILVSDGASSDLDAGAIEDIGNELQDARITLFHIHVAEDAIPQEVVDIAEKSGGQAFEATDRMALARVFRRIDAMRPARYIPLGTVPMDFFLPFALAGAGLLLIHVLALFGLRYTPW